MYFIDPHVHMISRTTDDYERMARMGCVAISEPAFWAGCDRGSVECACSPRRILRALNGVVAARRLSRGACRCGPHRREHDR